MSSTAKLQAILDRAGIRYFSAKELLFLGASNATLKLNTEPPENLWVNILPTIKVLDQARGNLGFPLVLISVYRNPAYNAAIKGSKGSLHMQFNACDVRPLHTTASRISALYNELHRLRRLRHFSGGIGRYPNFVHVDTRGKNADF